MGYVIRWQFYFSPNQFFGRGLISPQIEEPQKKMVHLYRSTRNTSLSNQ